MAPSRGSGSTMETLSPRKASATIDQGESRLAALDGEETLSGGDKKAFAHVFSRSGVRQSGTSPTRERLGNIDLRIHPDGITQLSPIPYLATVNEHHHVRPSPVRVRTSAPGGSRETLPRAPAPPCLRRQPSVDS